MRRRKVSRRRRRRGGLWPWLGVGALGLAATAILTGGRRRREPGTARRHDHESAPLRAPIAEPPADTQASWIPGPSGSLRVLERHRDGGLAVLFVHGLGGWAEQWAAQLAAAGPALHVVAVDLPGHGGSDPATDGDYSIAALSAALGAVLDGLRCRRAILVGHGLGASAAIEYAGSHPGRISGLLLVDPSGDQTHQSEARRQEFLEQLRRDPSEELDWYFRQILVGAEAGVADRVLDQLANLPPEVASSALESSLAYSPLDALKRYDGAVRNLVSDLNTLPFSLHNLLPELPVRHLAGASHWLMMDRPDEVWAMLVDLLEQIAIHDPRDPASL